MASRKKWLAVPMIAISINAGRRIPTTRVNALWQPAQPDADQERPAEMQAWNRGVGVVEEWILCISYEIVL